MNPHYALKIVFAMSALAVLVGSEGVAGQNRGAAAVKIEITDVPPQDCGGPTKQATIAGKVVGSVSSDQRIVVYSAACNGVLYVQPTAAAPFTRLSEGLFNSYIHLGHTYYVLLVKDSFKPKPEISEADVPLVGGEVVAIAKVPGKK